MTAAQLRALDRAVDGFSDLERRCLLARARGLRLREIGELLNLDVRRVAQIIDAAVTLLKERVQDPVCSPSRKR